MAGVLGHERFHIEHGAAEGELETYLAQLTAMNSLGSDERLLDAHAV
jgi:hypothetical protein